MKKSEATPFVAMGTRNKCANVHADTPGCKKIEVNLASVIELSEMAKLCITVQRNPMQASNIGGSLIWRIFPWKCFFCGFRRICLSTFSTPWSKKVKYDQKSKPGEGVLP